jgi:hypothetical protein
VAHAGKEPTSKAEAHAGTHGPGRYFVVWAILLAFTGITVGTGYMDLVALNLPLALAMALRARGAADAGGLLAEIDALATAWRAGPPDSSGHQST